MGPRLGRDVFLALAAVGWADGSLDQDEADAIVRTALEEGLDLKEIAEIEGATKKPVSIGDIDLTRMTKADRLFVYAVASWMARLDGEVSEAEIGALGRLGEVLRIPERPRVHADSIAKEIGHLTESEKPSFYDLPKLRRTLKVRLAVAEKLRAEQAHTEAVLANADALGEGLPPRSDSSGGESPPSD